MGKCSVFYSMFYPNMFNSAFSLFYSVRANAIGGRRRHGTLTNFVHLTLPPLGNRIGENARVTTKATARATAPTSGIVGQSGNVRWQSNSEHDGIYARNCCRSGNHKLPREHRHPLKVTCWKIEPQGYAGGPAEILLFTRGFPA